MLTLQAFQQLRQDFADYLRLLQVAARTGDRTLHPTRCGDGCSKISWRKDGQKRSVCRATCGSDVAAKELLRKSFKDTRPPAHFSNPDSRIRAWHFHPAPAADNHRPRRGHISGGDGQGDLVTAGFHEGGVKLLGVSVPDALVRTGKTLVVRLMVTGGAVADGEAAAVIRPGQGDA